MKANASKFQALCVSKDLNPPILELCIDGVVIRNESHVKRLDQQSCFNYNIIEMYKHASCQKRVLTHLPGMLNVEIICFEWFCGIQFYELSFSIAYV